MSLEGQVHIAEWSSSVARRAHNPEVAGSNPVSAIEKRDTRKNLVSFFMPCDRRVPGAAAPTAAGGRRRKVMQARNREFRRLNAERESGRPDFEVGKAGSNPVSASEKEIQEKILYLRVSTKSTP